MNLKELGSKSTLKKAGNFLFIGLLLLFIFSTDAKSWVLQQLVTIGVFRAEIKNDAPAKNVAGQTISFLFNGEDGKAVSTSGLKGKVVFINFWATWCPPCRAEMPSLNALYNKLKDDDRFVFLFINEDENASKAKAYLQNNRYAFPFVTRAGNIPTEIFSGTLPTTVILNKEGNVVMKHEGLANYNADKFLKQLNGLL
jgi:thiol-disulfide isomerase/thioredoxin